MNNEIRSQINLYSFFKSLKIFSEKHTLNVNFYYNSLNFQLLDEFDKKNYINFFNKNNCSIRYIITIKYTKTNTLLSVTNSKGLLLFFTSAGQLIRLKKKKVSRMIIIKKLLNLMISKVEFLKDKPIALHLQNVDFNKIWVLKFLKNKFFIKTINFFDIYPHNGCRKKKMKRKKFRSFAKKEEMAERFKAADCKSVELVSS